MTHPLLAARSTIAPRLVCELHFHPSDLALTDVHMDDAVEFWDLTNKESGGIAEQSQAGINSRTIRRGRPRSGEELSDFDEIVRRSSNPLS